MAGKGGGAWKVAYADFVTAMMAFFLVMWITSQDTKIKEAIAHYFEDPMGYLPLGTSNKPADSGAIFEGPAGGVVPGTKTRAMGRGRFSHTDGGVQGPATEMVSDWIMNDPQLTDKWQKQADRSRKLAAEYQTMDSREHDQDDLAARLLADELQSEIRKDAPSEGLYGELIQDSLDLVQWREIAEDILSE
jgi:flagellar motor protein MotB